MLPPARMLVIQKWCVRFRRRASQFLGRVLASLQDADRDICLPGVRGLNPRLISVTPSGSTFWHSFGMQMRGTVYRGFRGLNPRLTSVTPSGSTFWHPFGMRTRGTVNPGSRGLDPRLISGTPSGFSGGSKPAGVPTSVQR